ncbi:MAG TPA: class I SAM-dependent methyltransferase [Candidatus Limnocylindrales bacterium]|nr:class I SAM-dependent methyltransferase [Candidatus Limnocylindrales bacterium]
MDCCDPSVYDDHFDAKRARDQLRAYRRDGPRGWSSRLIAELAADGVDGLTVLDIGAGVGAVHHALLAQGAASAVDVDASGPYLEAAQGEAARRGIADRVTYLKGDAVALGDAIPEADLVALDRVVCCYPDMDRLVTLAATRARRRLGLVVPRDDAWIRAFIALENRVASLGKRPLLTYVHRTHAITEVVAAAGLVPASGHKGRIWQTLVYARA